MSAMRKMPDGQKPGKRGKPDSSENKGHSAKGKPFGKPDGRKQFTSKESSPESKPYRKRTFGASESEDTAAPARRSGPGGRPSSEQPWKKSDKPSGGKFRRDEPSDRPARPAWKRDNDDRPPRKSYHKKEDEAATGSDRPYRSRKPATEGETGSYERKSGGLRKPSSDRPWQKSDKPAGNRSHRADKTERTPRPAWKRDDDENAPKRPYRSTENDTKPRDHSDRKSYEKKPYERKPYERKPFDKRSEKPSHGAKPKGKAGYDADGTIRLNKYIANSGVCSRREADTLIQSGAVSVNGVVVTELGTKITRDDKVQFGGETLHIEKKVYLLLNKPKGYITTVDDPQERNTVMMLIRDACRERIYPVGRLDRNTTGLLLFTNDGEMAKKLMHPGHKVRKVYHVEISTALSKADMQKLSEGVELEDGIMAVDEIAYTGVGTDKKNIGVVIHSGKNRVVRRLFEALDYEVVKLDRVAFANLTKKDLPRGRWRFLEESELNVLKMI